MGSKASRIVGAGFFFKGGKTSSVSRIASVNAGKWATGLAELSVLAPFLKGGSTSSVSQLAELTLANEQQGQ
jgi:hypothetical protein